MRLKYVPGSKEAIAASPCVMHEPEKQKGHWNEWFGNDRPIRLEVGTGKGRFLVTLASKSPEYNYIGIEKYSSVLIRAVEKLEAMREASGNPAMETAKEADRDPSAETTKKRDGDASRVLPLSNLVFVRMDAEQIEDVFGENEIDRIYLNFSDPWPKNRQAKHRLPSRQFLARYATFLKPDGKIEFKTDNRDLFDFALRELGPAGWEAELVTYDLHADPVLMQDNIMTEYEERFSGSGTPICKYVIHRAL